VITVVVLAVSLTAWVAGLAIWLSRFARRRRVTGDDEWIEREAAASLFRARQHYDDGDYPAAGYEYGNIVLDKPNLVEPRLEYVRALILTNDPEEWLCAADVLEESQSHFKEECDLLVAAYLRAFLRTLRADLDGAAQARQRIRELLAKGARAPNWDVRRLVAYVDRFEFDRSSGRDLSDLNLQWQQAHGGK